MNDARSFGPKPKYPLVEAQERWPSQRGMMVIAGPCSIESREQVAAVLGVLKATGVSYVRGGPWTYGTYPPEKTGLRLQDLKMFTNAVRATGLQSIVEVLDLRLVDEVARHADALQVGARQAQNYPLLEAMGETGKVVTLKRGVGMTVDEWLGAGEYILKAGGKLVLIERGSATYHDHVRWGVDITSIAYVASRLDVPVIVDASHGTGRRDLVAPVTFAGLAAGADGFLVEVHPDPEKSRSDAEQAYPLMGYPQLYRHALKTWELAQEWGR